MTMTTQAEIERKYDVTDDASAPDLAGLDAVGVESVAPPIEYELAAEYFDTADGALAARRITLRRRRGGSDEGWHVKLPAAVGRTEVHWPIDTGDDGSDDGSGVPSAVREPIRGAVRDHPLDLIARVTTHRTVTRLLGNDGSPMVEFADDRVTASDIASGSVRIWREWEVEVLEGAPEDADGRAALLDAVEKRLRTAGARHAASASKLATALGRTSLDGRTPLGLPSGVRHLTRASATVEVLGAAIAALVRDLEHADAAVRRDAPDGVHAFRTRVRRVRSLLKAYPSVYDRSVASGLDDELAWIGSVLSAARDAEVMVARATVIVDGHDQVSRSVLDQLTEHWNAVRESEYGAVRVAFDGDRYFRLLDALDAMVQRPPLGPDATRQAAEVVPAALDRSLRRVLRAAKAAEAQESESERIESLHSTRKAAKRLRYAAEAVSQGDGAVFGRKVRAVAGAAEAVHNLLGEHRDSLLMQEHLRATADRSGNAFDYGVLHELERLSSAMCLDDYRRALRTLRGHRR